MCERAFLAIALVCAFVFATAAPSNAGTFNPSWTRTEAQSYAWHGLHERYTFGGGKFIDNDRWDASCTYSCTSTQEGIDCSGFAAKVFAVPYQTPETTAYHPYPTY